MKEIQAKPTKFWRKNLEQKPKLVRDQDGKLKVCHRSGLGAQKG
jgi:hypothetical protein